MKNSSIRTRFITTIERILSSTSLGSFETSTLAWRNLLFITSRSEVSYLKKVLVCSLWTPWSYTHSLTGVAKIAISTSDEREVNWVGGHQAERFQNADELVRSHMLALCTVKVVEAWLEEDSLGDNLVVEALHYLNEAFEIGSAHEGSRLCFFHGAGRVGEVRENVVQIVAEI
jgi:hypothetical protein